jgi:hypothetical protein
MEPEFPSDEQLCDPASFRPSESVAIAKRRAQSDPLFGQRLARSLMDEAEPMEAARALRLLEILAAIFKPLFRMSTGSGIACSIGTLACERMRSRRCGT